MKETKKPEKIARIKKRKKASGLINMPKICICAYCGDEKPMFRSVHGKGPQCEECYREIKGKFNKRGKRGKKPASLEKKVDHKFSIVIRLRGMVGEFIPCYTCDALLTFNEAQCGHFIPRGNHSTRWLLENCRPQCFDCNEGMDGNLTIFEKNLENEIPGVVERLRMLGHLVYKPTHSDYLNMLEDFSKQIKDIESLRKGYGPYPKDL
jgi:hypothetical protein